MIGMKKKKFIIYLIVAFLVGALVTGAGAVIVAKGALGYVGVPKDEYKLMSETYRKYGKLEQLYQNMDRYYYKDVNEQDVLDGAYKGMVAGLGDPYSAYMNKKEYTAWKASATGEYSGIGVTFTADKANKFIIISVTKDSPAEKAGLKAGDQIIKVDGKTYEDMDIIADKMRGKAGTKVKVNYLRNGTEKEVEITRAKIVEKSVDYKMLDGGIGYVQLSSFITSSPDDFKAALTNLKAKGAKGIILDLRDNGGGLVNSCIEIADQFLDEGVVTYVEDKNKKRTEYESKDGNIGLKTVVLVNENSASCSEILAAALQDNGFKLVGQTTFGKGVIQSTMEMKDGSALKLTIMQYFSPKGNAIHNKGVKPDYEVKNGDAKTDSQLEKAKSLF